MGMSIAEMLGEDDDQELDKTLPADIKANLQLLKECVERELPETDKVLRTIHKQLNETEECAYLLNDDEIALLMQQMISRGRDQINNTIPAKDKPGADGKPKKVGTRVSNKDLLEAMKELKGMSVDDM